ncbi:MAG TPA: hypothetical protein VKN64_10730 [Halanaerobiales bacterium]|nr:hypothetical protein [Halanaerobiales bacterium]
MIRYMDLAARIVIGFGYLLVGYVIWKEGKKIMAERKKDDTKEKTQLSKQLSS